MKKRILLILAIVGVNIGFAQIQPEEILFIPWNSDSMGNVITTLDPEGRVGPQNFQIAGETIYLLDQQNQSINVYRSKRLTDGLPVLPTTRDFIIQSVNDYSCLADNAVVVYQNRKLVETIRHAKPLPLIWKIEKNAGEIVAINHDGTASIVENHWLAKSNMRGIPVANNHFELKKLSRSEATITQYDTNGKKSAEINLAFVGNNLGSFRLIGVDQSGRLFLDVDLIIQDIPLRVQREIWVLNQDGDRLGKIPVPAHYYAMMWNDMRLTDDGMLYHMLSAEDGIHIMKWKLSPGTEDLFKGVYPEKFQKYLHYNDAILPETLEKKSPLNKPTATVTRAEALAIGDTYVVHMWAATLANITGGLITDPNGAELQTPSWVQVGTNYKVPYKWGGFNTLPQFDQGLLDGKSAGDNATSDVSRYAVGVDCSGFVSRCWKLSSHYSTRMMDDYIAQAYSSWEDLKPGDAIHREGHVRLAVDNNPNGSIFAVEAAGSSTDWRVDYKFYTYSQLSDYTPRYYINMTGPSFPMAQPVLTSVTNDSKAHINWNLSSAENISGIQIQHSVDGLEWESLLDDSLISTTITEFSREWNDGPWYIRLKSINNDGDIAESLPSDVYGYYTPPACAGKVLIVDGFDRGSGSWGLPYHSFAEWMGKALAELRIPFETVANETVISGDILLSNYQAVYWILGDESTVDETFSTAEQGLVATYLENGGQLFVSGSEIAWDLYGQDKESTADRSFLLNYLHAGYVNDDAKDYSVTGTDGGIFADLSFKYDDGTGGIYQEDYPDVIAPKQSAAACLEYSSGITAGIQYEGTFSDGIATGKLVYFGFPWETITTFTDRKAVLKNISEWFGFICAGIDPENPLIPQNPTLSHGYPNPFNSRVTFELITPDNEPFDIFVYNSQGRIVRQLTHSDALKSEYHLIWDGRNDHGQMVASGCYFFQVATHKYVLTEKIIFLK